MSDKIVDLGITHGYAHDRLNRLTSEWVGNGVATQVSAIERTDYGYYKTGQLKSVRRLNTDASKDLVAAYEYDARGLLSKETLGVAPDTLVTTYAYDDTGKLQVVTAPNGGQTTYQYDNVNHLKGIIYPDADPNLPAVDMRNYVETSSVSAKRPMTFFTTDVLGNVTEVRERIANGAGQPVYRKTKYVYDSVMRPVIMDQLNVTDETGVKQTARTTYQYTAAGDLRSVTDPLLRTTSYEYDGMGRVIEVHLPVTSTDVSLANRMPVYQYFYDVDSNLATEINPEGHARNYKYDKLDRQIETWTDGTPREFVGFRYDDAGRLYQQWDSSGTTTYEWDEANRLTRVVYPNPTTGLYDSRKTLDDAGSVIQNDNPLVEYTYDKIGNRTKQRQIVAGNAATRVLSDTSYVYDNLQRIKEVHDPDSTASGFAKYDYVVNKGDLLRVTDAAGFQTEYTYDLLGRVTAEKQVGGGASGADLTSTYGYDTQSNLLSKVDRNGRTTAYTYDDWNRIETEKWISATVLRTITSKHLVTGELYSTSDIDHTYVNGYDPAGRLKSVTETLNGLSTPIEIGYQRNRLGQATQRDTKIGNTYDARTTWVYDSRDRVSTIQQGDVPTSPNHVVANKAVADKLVNMTYDANGRLRQIGRMANSSQQNITTDYAYDKAGRLTDVAHASAIVTQSPTWKQRYHLEYDQGSRITGLGRDDGNDGTINSQLNYRYSFGGQLVAVNEGAPSDLEQYSYNANGSRTSYKAPSAGVSANTGTGLGSQNRYTNDGVYNYQYDNEGNVTRKTVRVAGTGTDSTTYTAFAWDYRNRLTDVTDFTSSVQTHKVSYTYDAFDQVISRKEYGGVGSSLVEQSYYAYADGQMIMEFGGVGAGAVALTHRYLWGPAVDQLLADEPVTGAGTPSEVLWALSDHLGSVRTLINQNGILRKEIDYDSFGNVRSETFRSTSGATVPASDPAAVDQLFRFTGRFTDEDTALQNNLHRWYDPKIGRWLSEDPIGFAGGDANLYRYVGNGVTGWRDPSGLEKALEPSGPFGPEWNEQTHRAEIYYTTDYAPQWFNHANLWGLWNYTPTPQKRTVVPINLLERKDCARGAKLDPEKQEHLNNAIKTGLGLARGSNELFNNADVTQNELLGGIAGAGLGGYADDLGKAGKYSDEIASAGRGRPGGGGPTSALTGQIHHPISTKVARAVDNHPILRGVFKKRDPRFVTQAADKNAHCGYQRWHIDLDNEVVEWIQNNPSKDADDFLAYLRELYKRPDVAQRFPNGF